MKIELRIRNLEELKSISKTNVDSIGIGDEGCVLKLPLYNEALEFKRKIIKKGFIFRYVTPKVPEKHFNDVIDTIELLYNDGADYCLTINDIGVLDACKQKGILPSHVTIGRAISRSFEDCLWYKHILRNEDDFTRKSILQNNMAHKIKIEFLKKYNVKSIESNMLNNQCQAFKNIKCNGFNINVHYGLITVAFSRVCQTAKYLNEDIKNCSNLCSKKIDISLKNVWYRKNGKEPCQQELSEELKKIEPSFSLLGNVLYRECRTKLSEYNLENIDLLIFNTWQFKTASEIVNIIKKLNRGEKNA